MQRKRRPRSNSRQETLLFVIALVCVAAAFSLTQRWTYFSDAAKAFATMTMRRRQDTSCYGLLSEHNIKEREGL